MTAPRTFFIGDVHGCREELERLLAEGGYRAKDRAVLVGDLVAKGPDSAGVVRLARELQAFSVLGNHDAHVLKRRGATGPGLRELKPEHRQVVQTLRDADWDFLEQLPLLLRFPEWNVVVVHGGLLPGVPVDRQEGEQLLYLRSINPEGKPSRRVDEGRPWASLWAGPERAVFGHDARRGLQRHPMALGLDTGCVYGGALTAWVMPDDRLVQVKARRAYFDPG